MLKSYILSTLWGLSRKAKTSKTSTQCNFSSLVQCSCFTDDNLPDYLVSGFWEGKVRDEYIEFEGQFQLGEVRFKKKWNDTILELHFSAHEQILSTLSEVGKKDTNNEDFST